jgi:hypothetical protein
LVGADKKFIRAFFSDSAIGFIASGTFSGSSDIVPEEFKDFLEDDNIKIDLFGEKDIFFIWVLFNIFFDFEK